jgi:hypothetical protein
VSLGFFFSKPPADDVMQQFIFKMKPMHKERAQKHMMSRKRHTRSQGMERIFAVKHRQLHVPLAICVADVEDVARFGSAGHLQDGLLSALLPGAVTVILTRLPDAPLCAALNPGVTSIGESTTGKRLGFECC